MFELSDALNDYFGGSFDAVMAVEGEVHRAKEGRRTVSFFHEGQEYFAKVHNGIGWGEVLKNLFYLKLPAADASAEWQAAALLKSAGVKTVEIVGRGLRGWNPATRQSFVVMKGLEERETADVLLKQTHNRALRRLVIRKVAESTRRMHEAGMNHRDCYLCHFHLPVRDWSQWAGEDDFDVPVIDLHRAQLRDRVPRRWLVKDLGALLFSSLDCGVSDREIVAFLQIYLGSGWKTDLRDNGGFWRDVIARAIKFCHHEGMSTPTMPGIFGRNS